jgi:hypothetical protein
MDRPLSKVELMKQMERFMADKNRGISIDHFSQIAGYESKYLISIFKEKIQPISEGVQIRVSKALASWKRGEIRVMIKPHNNTKFVEYRPKGETKQKIQPKISFDIRNGAIRLQPGPVNRMDYSTPGLDELIGD